jgi:hypothetical protein
MCRSTFRPVLVVLLATLAVWSALPVTPGAAQDLTVRFGGRVSWIAGDTLVVSTDDTPSVRVDLSQVDQGEYQNLVTGDRVIVTGIIPANKDRVVATSIMSLAP